jgi:hypothetical protein
MGSNTTRKSTEDSFFTTPIFDKYLLTIKEASMWATNHLGKIITSANISYLIQYGRIRKIDKDGVVFISLNELNEYYKSYKGSRELSYKEKLGAV